MVRAMPRRRSPRLAAPLLALALFVLGAAAAIAPSPLSHGEPVVEAAPAEKFITTPGPLGPITVIGDSVLLGSLLTSPTLADTLAARGWGPVRMRAGEGYSTGVFNVDSTFKVSNWIRTWRQQGWDPVDVVVNLGANDSGFCMSDTNCAYSAIMFLVDAIGPGHRIWWPKITRFYTHEAQQNAWNQALDRVDQERADFWTWDWPFEMAHGGYSSPDQTHLSGDGYRQRSRVMAREITADLAFARHVGADAPLATAIGDPAEFVPLPPVRVLDTRDNGGARLAAGTSVDVDMTPYVPSGTTAVAVNLTTDQSSAPGFLTGYPCDRPRQEVSNVNSRGGRAARRARRRAVVGDRPPVRVHPRRGARDRRPARRVRARLARRRALHAIGDARAPVRHAPDRTRPDRRRRRARRRRGGRGQHHRHRRDVARLAESVPVRRNSARCLQRQLPARRHGGERGVRAGCCRRHDLRAEHESGRRRRRSQRRVRRRRRTALRPHRSDTDARHAVRYRRLDALPGRRTGDRCRRRSARGVCRHRHDHARRPTAGRVAEDLPRAGPSRRRPPSTPAPRPCSPTP